MDTKILKKRLKTTLSVLVLIALIFIVGCDLLPFGKKDTAQEAAELQSETDKIFGTIETNAKDFDAFLKKLKKRWYSAKDVADFASSISSFKQKIATDTNDLKQVKSKLDSLARLDAEKKFGQYISSKTKASESLSKVLQNSQTIVAKLDPKIVKIAELYTRVDEVKQNQSKYASALLVNSKRIEAASTVQTLRDIIIAGSTAGDETGDDTDSDTGDETGDGTEDDTGSGGDTSAIEIIDPSQVGTLPEIPDAQKSSTTATGDTGSNTAISSTSSDNDLAPWVYQITENEWPTELMRDAIKDISEKFSDLYENTYALHKEVNFQNSRKLVKYTQEISTDTADYLASIDAIIDNLKETKRLEKLQEKKNSVLTSLKASKSGFETLANERPSGVSSDSLAKRGIDEGTAISKSEIKRYEDDLKEISDRLKSLEESLEGTLDTDYQEAIWRASGSFVALYDLNMNISRSLMHETKSWKSKEISKYVLNRAEHLAEAKYQDYKAEKAYSKHKIASH